VGTHGYSWILKIYMGTHNGYSTDMGTGTRQIFIQRVRYEGATTHTLTASLTSLVQLLISLNK